MENIYKQIGNNIKEIRKALGLTQEKVAEQVGIEPPFFGQIERGVGIPSIKSLVKIADALDVDVSDLFPAKRKPRKDLQREAVNIMLKSASLANKKKISKIVRVICGKGRR
jgi:transcriptional regulator with XRE-family HTH domain